MELNKKMSLLLNDFITNASFDIVTLVQGQENEIQQQCLSIPGEFPHQEPVGKAVVIENNFYVATFANFKPKLDVSSVLTLQGLPNCGQHKEQTVVLDTFGHECCRFNEIKVKELTTQQ